MEYAKEANKLVKQALERLTEPRDIHNFEDVPTIFNNAAGMVNGDARKEALLEAWMLSQATNIIFLLWRRQIEHDDLEKEWRKLPTTDEAALAYEELLKKDNEEADKLDAERRDFMGRQHELDIFKSVLNGVSKEEAEKQSKEYEEKVAKTLGA